MTPTLSSKSAHLEERGLTHETDVSTACQRLSIVLWHTPGTAPEGSPRDPQAAWRSCFSWVCVRVTVMVRAGDEGMRETVQQGWDGWAKFKKHFPDRLAKPEDPFRPEGDVDWIAAKDSSLGNGPMVTPIIGVGN